ncbi:hypothetical protein CPAV1605_699 [seawater metagenome]|uniref:Fe2OG dioxygenase domain-containing protein n=1 Tax=seawater metagenome TaxID=1561972 RepID=A0A5E8CJZ6_9ZZZZ
MADNNLNEQQPTKNNSKSTEIPENRERAVDRLNKVPLFTIINDIKNNSKNSLPLMILKGEHESNIPMFLRYEDAEKFLETTKMSHNVEEGNFKIISLGLQTGLRIFSDIVAKDPKICVLPVPELSQIDIAQVLHNPSDINFPYIKITNSKAKNSNQIEKCIWEKNCLNVEDTNELIKFYIKNSKSNKIVNLQAYGITLFNKMIKNFCYELIIEKFNYKPNNVKAGYIIEYTKNSNIGNFHFDDCSLVVRIFLNTNYKGGGIEFKDQNITYKPKYPGDMIIYPGRFSHINRQIPIKEGSAFVLTAFIE